MMAASYKAYLSLIMIGILAAAFFFGALSMLIFNLQPTMVSSNPNKMPTVNFVLYAGETSNGKFGFGTTPDNLTSPGPTLRFTTFDVVSITVINVGKLPHAFAITTRPDAGATVLFNAAIGSASKPLQSGQNGSVTFVPNSLAFDYWYISPVSEDTAAGMYGAISVTSVTGPAFP